MPHTKQTIAIIGADGNEGSTMAKRLCNGNYRLLLLSKDLASVQSLVEQIIQTNETADVCAMECKYDACWEADIIILSVSGSEQKKVAELVKKVAIQKIVITITNKTAGEMAASPQASDIETLLPNSKIVKIFNTDFAQPVKNKNAVDAFIAGDNENALQTVSELLKTAGFNPILKS